MSNNDDPNLHGMGIWLFDVNYYYWLGLLCFTRKRLQKTTDFVVCLAFWEMRNIITWIVILFSTLLTFEVFN